jgi:hypothetical protein
VFLAGRRSEGVRVDLGKREVPEREPHTSAYFFLDEFDLAERPPRVRAFTVGVLKNERATAGPRT